jgi:hypothetical protein
MTKKILNKCEEIFAEIQRLDFKEKVNCINKVRKELHKYSPFRNEPVDCIQWVEQKKVESNDYNPNKVAPPEMELLKVSIEKDGFTQPIVSWKKQSKY